MPTLRRSSSERIKYRYGICLNDNCSKCKTKEVQKIPIRKELVCAECEKPLRECPPPRTWWQKHGKMTMLLGAVALCLAIGALLLLLPGGNTDKHEPAVALNDSVGNESSASDSLKVGTETVGKDTIHDTIQNIVHDTVTVIKKVPEKTSASKQSVGKETVSKKQKPANDKGQAKQKAEPASTTCFPTGPTKAGPAKAGGKGCLNLSYGTYVGEIKNGYPEGMGRLTYSRSRQINRYDKKGRTASAGDYVIGEFVHGFLVQGKHYSANGDLIESLIVGVPAGGAYESK